MRLGAAPERGSAGEDAAARLAASAVGACSASGVSAVLARAGAVFTQCHYGIACHAAVALAEKDAPV